MIILFSYLRSFVAMIILFHLQGPKICPCIELNRRMIEFHITNWFWSSYNSQLYFICTIFTHAIVLWLLLPDLVPCLFWVQALDTFNTAVVSPIYYVMFTSLTILASVIMFKVILSLIRSFRNPFIGGYDNV